MSETNGVDMSNRKDVDSKRLAREEKLRDAKIEDQVRYKAGPHGFVYFWTKMLVFANFPHGARASDAVKDAIARRTSSFVIYF